MAIDFEKVKADLQAGKKQFDLSAYPLTRQEFEKLLGLMGEANANQITHLSFAMQHASVWLIDQTSNQWGFHELLHIRLAVVLDRHKGSLEHLDLSRCNLAFHQKEVKHSSRFDSDDGTTYDLPAKTMLSLTRLKHLNLNNSYFAPEILKEIIALPIEEFICQSFPFMRTNSTDAKKEIALSLLQRQRTKLPEDSEKKPDLGKGKEKEAGETEEVSTQTAEDDWWLNAKKRNVDPNQNFQTVSLNLARSLIRSSKPTLELQKDKLRLLIMLLLDAGKKEDAEALLSKAVVGLLSKDLKMPIQEEMPALPQKAEKLVRLCDLKAAIKAEALRLELAAASRSRAPVNSEPQDSSATYNKTELVLIGILEDFSAKFSKIDVKNIKNERLLQLFNKGSMLNQEVEQEWPLSFFKKLNEDFETLSLAQLHQYYQAPLLEKFLKDKFGAGELLFYEELLLQEVLSTKGMVSTEPSTSSNNDSSGKKGLTVSQLTEQYERLYKELFNVFNELLTPVATPAARKKRKEEIEKELERKKCDSVIRARVLEVYDYHLSSDAEESLFLSHVLKKTKAPEFTLLDDVLDIYALGFSEDQRTILLVILQYQENLSADFVAAVFELYFDRALQPFFLPCFYFLILNYLSGLKDESIEKNQALSFLKEMLEVEEDDKKAQDPIVLLKQAIYELFAEQKDNPKIFALLAKAVSSNWQKIIEVLIVLNVPIATTLPSARTALHLAAIHGYTEIVRLLLPNFTAQQLNVTDYSGATAADLALQSGNCQVVLMLCLAGADLDIKDARGKKATGLLDKKSQAEYQGLKKLIKIFQLYRDGEYSKAKCSLVFALKKSSFNFNKTAKRESLLKLMQQAIEFDCCNLSKENNQQFLQDVVVCADVNSDLHKAAQSRLPEKKEVSQRMEKK